LLLSQLKLELDQLAIRLEEAEVLVEKTAQESEVCRRLDAIPGIGPLTATALIAAIGNGAAFRKGREFAAWVGLVPREHSTGGKQKLLGIKQARELLFATVVCTRCTSSPAVSRQAVSWPECVVGTAYFAHSLQCRRCRFGGQAGTHDVSRAYEGRSLSASFACRQRFSSTGLQMTPG
jgi:hypothetical protein